MPTPAPETVAALSDAVAASDEPEAAPVPTMIGNELEVEAERVAAEAAIEDIAAVTEVGAAGIVAADAVDEPYGAIAAVVGAQETDELETVDTQEPVTAALDAEPVPLRPIDPETDELAAAAAAQTHGLLDKFRARPVIMPEPKPILSTPVTPRVMTPPTPPLPLVAAAQAPVTAPVPPTIAPTPPPASMPGPAHLPYAAAGPMAVPAPPQPYGVIGRPQTGGTPPSYPAQPAMPYAAQTPPSYDPPTPPPYAGQIGQPYAPAAAPIQPYPAPLQPQGPSTPAMYPPFQPGYTSPPLQPQYGVPQPAPQYAPPPQAPAPSWRMVAPESPYVAPAQGNGHVYSAPPTAAFPEPQWPDAPSWPTPVPPASRTRGAEAVWAESTRDLLSRPETGVSACFNCGLPLSATARFCRRCGNSQVSA
jgi:hypothetical protein